MPYFPPPRCPHCGKPIANWWTVCPECGGKLKPKKKL